MIVAATLIPPLDEFGLPGPLRLFEFLLPATFFLHIIFMNIALGTAVMVVPMWFASKSRPHLADAVIRLVRFWPIAVSLTITTGVAPLLFVQTLYGHVFYTANILLGWRWLAIIGLLLAAFYLIYFVRRCAAPSAEDPRGPAILKPPTLLAILAAAAVAVAFLAIATLFTANSTLMLVPDAWRDVRDGRASPFFVHAMFWPRLLHNVIGSCAVTTMTIAVQARRAGQVDEPRRRSTISFGLLATAMLTIPQIITGVWLVATIWSDAAATFHQLTPGIVLWAVGIAAGMASFFVLMFYSLNHPARPLAVRLPAGLIAVTLAGMSAARERLRVGMLEHAGVPRFDSGAEHVQTSAVWAFVITLIVGAGLIVLMVRWTLTARPPHSSLKTDTYGSDSS